MREDENKRMVMERVYEDSLVCVYIFRLNLIEFEFENLPPNLVGNCVEYT